EPARRGDGSDEAVPPLAARPRVGARLLGDRAGLSDGAARLRLGGRLVRSLDRDRARRARLVPLAVLDRRDVGQFGAGSSPEEEGDADEPSDRRIARHRRSAFAAMKAAERKGSAGSPPTSAAFAITIVSPYM